MKSKKGLLTMLVCLALIAVAGTSYATIITSNDTTKNVTTSNLDISLVQTLDGKELQRTSDGKYILNSITAMPGDTIDQSVAVKVAADSKASYIRVTANRYWSDQNGNKVDDSINPAMIQLKADNNNWIMIEDKLDQEIIYFYYRLPIDAGEISSEMISGFMVGIGENGNSNKYAGYQSHINFFAEGVQAVAGKDAMLAEWGVKANIGENNEIISLEVQ